MKANKMASMFNAKNISKTCPYKKKGYRSYSVSMEAILRVEGLLERIKVTDAAIMKEDGKAVSLIQLSAVDNSRMKSKLSKCTTAKEAWETLKKDACKKNAQSRRDWTNRLLRRKVGPYDEPDDIMEAIEDCAFMIEACGGTKMYQEDEVMCSTFLDLLPDETWSQM